MAKEDNQPKNIMQLLRESEYVVWRHGQDSVKTKFILFAKAETLEAMKLALQHREINSPLRFWQSDQVYIVRNGEDRVYALRVAAEGKQTIPYFGHRQIFQTETSAAREAIKLGLAAKKNRHC